MNFDRTSLKYVSVSDRTIAKKGKSTANHWANEESMKRYIRNTTVPYVEKTNCI